MIFVQYNLETEGKGKVGLLHNFPDMLPKEMVETGLLVEPIPEPEVIPNKSAILYVNTVTKELFYEYQDTPKTTEQIQAEKMESMQLAIAELIMGGM
jgi:hypothetical protein